MTDIDMMAATILAGLIAENSHPYAAGSHYDLEREKRMAATAVRFTNHLLREVYQPSVSCLGRGEDMTDITTKLRDDYEKTTSLCAEAADEIDNLREFVRHIRDTGNMAQQLQARIILGEKT